MIAPKIFVKHKCDTESLKKLATAKKKEAGWERLVNLIRDRIKDGRERSLKDYRVWAAVDLAYDAPFHQETPTLIRHILSTCHTADEVRKAVNSWGLCEGNLFCTQKAEDGSSKMYLNAPVFHEVLVPVVRAYVSVRLSKIFNDRNLTPLFKYEPQKYTELNRVRCEIVTDIVQTMATQFGYAENLKQMILNALLYSVCLEFPVEAWTCDKQEDADGNEITVREGIRYVSPHITRIGYDLQYPAATFNTDTGCTFGFYWSVMRAGDVVENPMYWNTKSVGYGTTDWLDKKGSYANYFEQAYPCKLELPRMADASKETDREKVANVYTASDYDKAIFVTHMFMKIVPNDYGIGTYKHKVWFRFIIGSDDTVMFAEPMAYRPITYAGYDPDQNRQKNASLALEILPWQDLLGNTLTQILLTIKRNLANMQFYDSDLVDKTQVELLQQRSQWQYQGINLIPYSGMKALKSGTDPKNSFHEVKFQYADTNQMTQTIGTIISILERLLVISPQEIGASATHQQSKAEIVLTNTNTTNRVSYTATFIDAAIDAKKVQLYDAAMAYMDADVVGQVSSDIPNAAERIKELGFAYDEKSGKAGRKMVVKGKKEKLVTLESFASTKDGPDRGNDMATAQAISLGVQSINQNQMVAQIVDPESVLEALTQAAKLAGAPDDFKIRVNKGAAMVNQLQQAMDEIKKMVESAIAENMKPAAEAVAEQEQKINDTQQSVMQLSTIVERLDAMIQNAISAPPVPPVQPPMPPPIIPPMPVPPVPPEMIADGTTQPAIIPAPAGNPAIMA